MKLSEHFTLSEFTRSETASRYGISNQPDDAAIASMRALCLYVLEPIRAHFGVPITVSSGYRSPQVNRKIGGSSTSQHMKGEAADINVWGVDTTEVFDWIVFYSGLDFDQCIHEFGSWVHISYTERRQNRYMALNAYRYAGRTRYDAVEEPLS
jgi:hypothetical protein